MPTQNLTVDGLDAAGNFAGDGTAAPFVIFDIDQQTNIAGPYASRAAAEAAMARVLVGAAPELDTIALSHMLTTIDNAKA